jgi:Fe-S protein assembly co-chaperone HscB
VPDYFALLNETRRPWIDSEAVKRRFLELSAEVHPDRVHNAGEKEKRTAQERYTELNAAYNCLREPKERLRHLLELELGTKPGQVQSIPPDLTAFFMEISQITREVDKFRVEKEKVTSPLLKVEWFTKSQEWREKLTAVRQKLESLNGDALAELKRIDDEWIARPDANSRAECLKALETIWRRLSFFARWNAQIQERVVQLSF